MIKIYAQAPIRHLGIFAFYGELKKIKISQSVQKKTHKVMSIL